MDALKELTASCLGPIGDEEVADLGLELRQGGMWYHAAVERSSVPYNFGGWIYILRNSSLE